MITQPFSTLSIEAEVSSTDNTNTITETALGTATVQSCGSATIAANSSLTIQAKQQFNFLYINGACTFTATDIFGNTQTVKVTKASIYDHPFTEVIINNTTSSSITLIVGYAYI